jgi:hypothetical protein
MKKPINCFRTPLQPALERKRLVMTSRLRTFGRISPLRFRPVIFTFSSPKCSVIPSEGLNVDQLLQDLVPPVRNASRLCVAKRLQLQSLKEEWLSA